MSSRFRFFTILSPFQAAVFSIILLLAGSFSSANKFIDIEDLYPETETTIIGSYLQLADTINNPLKKHDFLLNESWRIRNSFPSTSLHLSLYVIAHAESVGDTFNLVKAHSFAGVAYRLQGNYNKAIDLFFKGLNLAKRYQIVEQEGYAYINIANLYIYLEFYSQAYENLVSAHNIAQKINNKDMLSYIFLNKGRVLMNLDSLEHAIENIEASLNLRIETGNIAGQADCYKYLGDIYFKKDLLDDAQVNYQLALEKVNYSHDQHLLANIRLQQSRIYCRKERFKLAEPLALQAYNLGRELDSKLIIHDALRVLAKVDMNKRDFETAANRLILLRHYSDTLFNQQLSEKVMSMEFQLERQRQDARLVMLEKDKEIQVLMLEKQRFINLGLIILLLGFVVTGSLLLFLLRKLKRKNIQLSRQKEELKLINTAKDKMFMVIGHDLRGPVWNLRALIELLRDDIDEKDVLSAQENIFALTRAVQSVSDLLENLLYWAKSQDGKIIFKPSDVNFRAIVTECLEPYKPWAESKRIIFTMDIPEKLRPVNADANMLKTVIRNLVSNAIKYSHPSGQIMISIKESGDYQRFSIKDFGIGMDEDALTKFRFKDLPEPTKGTGSETGSGIGLSLCREFITRHSSEIMVLSSPGLGTEFYFDLKI